MNGDSKNGRSVAAILSDMKMELQEFAQTRIELLKRELQEKAAAIKAAIPLAAVGVLFLTTAFLIFSLALAALIATGFADNPYRWFFGCLAVAVLWSLCGAAALYSVKRRLSQQSMVPRKTIEVLSADKVWLQKEARKAS
ncbi:MAG TPA: phage holin family protein [Candidatus Sulfotelmatobacter sp.]|nr:phage holin family protein [Candidatus Sulfotelmatobacter sp.]